jgi:hypothetical protein
MARWGRTTDIEWLSHHVDPTWSIRRDDAAATTVELPAGTTLDDIAEVSLHRIVVGTDTGAAVHVTRPARGFLLGADYRPGPALLDWTGDVELTGAQPSAVVWSR